jgi:sugar lactone lactonase YvrE
MSVMPSKSLSNGSLSKWKIFSFPILALVSCAAGAWAQAPAVLVDAQQAIATGFNSAQSIAVSKNGTIYVADTKNNQIVSVVNGVNTPVPTGTFVLTTPQALTLDANGDLFVGDTPTTGTTSFGRIIELAGDGKGNLTGVATSVFSGAPLTNPIALTVDAAGTLFIGDYPPSGDGAIYSLALGGTPQLLNITGLNAPFTPAALLRDSSTNLYIADNGNFTGSNGGVYIVADTGGAAQPVATGAFVINQPSGLTFDSAGDLFILSLLGTGTGFNAGQQVVIVPAASPTTPYILPNSGLGASSSMAFDPQANLDVLDFAAGQVTQLDYLAPANLGSTNVGQNGAKVLFNFEYNQPTTLRGFRFVSQGDTSTELTQANGGNCTNGNHTNLPGGGPRISNYFPYTCQESFMGSPAYPGFRSSAIQVRGGNTGNTILASTSVYQTGLAGAEVTYPVTETTTATGLQQPQSLAISGLDNRVYVADTQAGRVYSINGLGGAGLTRVSTGTIPIQAPSALALDGAGNLFIADFNLGEVIEVPTTTGLAPSVVISPGGLLQHPMALAFDFLGNLYIGDAGPAAFASGSGDPGFVVKLPAGGAAFKMTIPSAAPIVFPQALATDPKTAALWIGDGGDASGVGQVVQVSADGTTATTTPINGVTNPTGLALDPAGDLYVLDGNAETLTVVPPAASALAPYLVDFDNTTLSAASALAISAGGQSFVIANIGTGNTNNLVYLNGNASALPFGNVRVGNQSPTMTATEYNIGNLSLTLQSPFYTTNRRDAAFSVLGSSICGNGSVLALSGSCTINVQFTPQFPGQTTQQINVQSNGYNSGQPTLTLSGTGTEGGGFRRNRRDERDERNDRR